MSGRKGVDARCEPASLDGPLARVPAEIQHLALAHQRGREERFIVAETVIELNDVDVVPTNGSHQCDDIGQIDHELHGVQRDVEYFLQEAGSLCERAAGLRQPFVIEVLPAGIDGRNAGGFLELALDDLLVDGVDEDRVEPAPVEPPDQIRRRDDGAAKRNRVINDQNGNLARVRPIVTDTRHFIAPPMASQPRDAFPNLSGPTSVVSRPLVRRFVWCPNPCARRSLPHPRPSRNGPAGSAARLH
jgi:hypothetical protein